MKLKRLAVRLLASVNLKFSKLKCNLHFLPRESKYWLDKDFAFVRVFGTIRATRKTGDKGVTVFHNLDADAISEVYISDSAPSTER